jgi:hypothetical protein
MPSNRPNLILDEQSFQDLLSAAFTIQAHNDQIKQARLTQTEPKASSVCQHCGAPKHTEELPCESCGQGEFRPGERLQRNWASMWLMSQEQGLWPERCPETGEGTQKDAPPPEAKRRPRAQGRGNSLLSKSAMGRSALDDPALDKTAAAGRRTTESTEDSATEEFAPEDSELTVQPFPLSADDDSSPTDDSIDATTDETTDASRATASSSPQRFADLRVTLRRHRADLYLGAAVFVAALALLWPAAGSPRRAALGPWERTLVTLGIAEAPAPVVHPQGDPGIEVWVDPHSALYYCPGEEQYGTTANGRFSSQREAQMDRFQPASRSACE